MAGNTFEYTHALCRAVAESFVDALKLHPTSIDVSLAVQQHHTYEALLEKLVPNLIKINADEAHPDCCFIEDTALMLDPHAAVITIPGHPSRQGETTEVKAVLQRLGITPPRLVELQPPATLDGGDVLYLGDVLLVGLSKRTNAEAVKQLSSLLAGKGVAVHGLPVRGDDTLHLKSVLTALDRNTLLLADTLTGRDLAEQLRNLPETAKRELVLVPDVTASNVLSIGHNVVMQEGFPESERIIRGLCEARGMALHLVCMAELAKADGALTCGSLLFSM